MSKNKSMNIEIFEGIRKPIAPPSSPMKNKRDKRNKKFDYNNELDKY